MLFKILSISLVTLTSHVSAHCIFLEPPSRPTIGKVKAHCNLPWNHNERELWCGGLYVQHKVNGGRCGICGDPFTGEQPHQAGGEYANGVIARSYRVGETIDVKIDVTANHMGFFTFAICPNNDIYKSPPPSCFKSNPLKVESPQNRLLVHDAHFVTAGRGIKEMRVKLPPTMSCSQCILQYTYTTGNNWGYGPQSAEVVTHDCLDLTVGKTGCGQQETFRGCADICIGDFCPQDHDTCITADKIKATAQSPDSSVPLPQFTTPNPVAAFPVITPVPDQGVLEKLCGVSRPKAVYSNTQSDWYCTHTCLSHLPASICAKDPVARFICLCDAVPIGPSVAPPHNLPNSDKICLNAVPRNEFNSRYGYAQWYCSQKCHHQRERDCYSDAISRVVCQCVTAGLP